MICHDTTIKELLPAYAEDALDGLEKQQVETHVASCDDCRRELSLLLTLAAEPVPDPGEAFWAQMPARVEREVRAQQSAGKRFDFSRLLNSLILPRWAWATAGLAAVLLLVWVAIGPFTRGEAPPLHEVYDAGYASVHDPVLTHPSTEMSDLSEPQLDTVNAWARQELTMMASESEAVMPNADRDVYEELSDLNGPEIDKLSSILNDYSEEG